MTFEDVLPGMYSAQLRYGKLPPVTSRKGVAPLSVTDLRLFASYADVYGSITRGGEPLGVDANVQFAGGRGFSLAEKEEYRARFLEPLFEDAQITIEPCNGSPALVTKQMTLRSSSSQLRADGSR